ncbi:MAG: type I restriction enzyme HsdR N-terminal domain-containing protein, partial [Desulfamplus sp.]|nr:type I restriction enzyme HsdR N-terminal domain-containing protein [Desulfamplus sp.]
LHKIIEKNLWIFGEQYNDTPVLFSDKSLKNNLTALRKELFDYELSEKDENIIDIEDNNLKNITDLFFFNEKILDTQKQEVMVVELKRPSCKINQKELNQLDRYKFNLEKNAKFSKEIYFKLILISSDFSDFAASKIGTQDKSNPFLYDITKDKKIELYVYKWSELIHSNKRRLSYLSNILKTKDRDIKDVFEKDYPDIAISDLVSTFANSKK